MTLNLLSIISKIVLLCIYILCCFYVSIKYNLCLCHINNIFFFMVSNISFLQKCCMFFLCCDFCHNKKTQNLLLYDMRMHIITYAIYEYRIECKS